MPTISMTGFGRAEKSLEGLTISVEMKTVNSRFLDISCRLPASFQRAEPEIQKRIRGSLKRGRVEVFVSRVEVSSSGNQLPSLSEEVFLAALSTFERGFELAGIDNVGLRKLEATRQALTYRGVVETSGKEPDPTQEIPLLLEVVDQALAALRAMREEEGRALEKELNSQLARFEVLVDSIAQFAANSPQLFQDRLKERIGRLLTGTECDPARLAQEVAFLVERADISEELARLKSHIEQFRGTLTSKKTPGGEAKVKNAEGNEDGGKKLEFLLQELGREVNTTGSKSQSIEISQAVVEAKLILERLREQVLNVE